MFVCRGALSAEDIRNLMDGEGPGSAASARLTAIPFEMSTEWLTEVTIVGVRVIDNIAIVEWPAEPGRSYQVQYKNSLDESEWHDLGVEVFADTIRVSIEDPFQAQPQRFYRVVTQP